MKTSHRIHHMGNASFVLLFTVGHAAVAFPTLRLWAEWCARRKRPR